jgi:hypothetical protein
MIGACAAAADELAKTRVLVETLEGENGAVRRRLETEKRAVTLLKQLNETRATESEALRNALEAKDQAIAAKNEVIVSQAKLIELLKKRKTSLWTRLGDVLLGAAAIGLLK